MTSIRKISAIPAKGHLVILTTKSAPSGGIDLSREEIGYVKEAFEKNERKPAILNRLNRVIIVLAREEKKEPYQTHEACRKAGANLIGLFNDFRIEEVTLVDAVNDPKSILALAEGAALGNYQFLKYKKDVKKEKNCLKAISIYSKGLSAAAVDRLDIALDATCRARDLVNEPVCYLTAVQLAEEFRKMGKEAGFKVEVLNKARIESLKMGGLLAVNRGSIDPPTFTIMEYRPKGAKNKKPVVLVGKGVVYDTGGLSLKPTPNSMDMMKCDMAGAAAVGGAMYAIAKAKLPVHVVGLVPATDNRPGENAYVPGDVINMMSGLNVEMLNADAEGRMILADALHYAKKYAPELVIDLATLTGAAVAAIGTFGIVSMGNAAEEVKARLRQSGCNTYERLAEMPFWEEYDELIKSDVGDIKNIGGPYAGAITAGKFLAHFVDYPWMHFDIAGPAFMTTKDSYRVKGGTGVGVRLLFDFIEGYSS
jgi:leucyl aminopeptidase